MLARRALSVLLLTWLLAIVDTPSSYGVTDVAPKRHHAAAAHHEVSLNDLLFPAINFGIYLFIIARYVIPAMREYLKGRQTEIAKAESTSSAALARAEQDIANSKARLASLQADADGIRHDLVAIANRQAERLIAQAQESGRRRLEDASLVAEQERRRAFAEVRADVASAAATLAKRKILAVLTLDDQRAFVQQFLEDAAPR